VWIEGRADTWVKVRADTWVRPYGVVEEDDAVKVVGHDHEGVCFKGGEFIGEAMPPCGDPISGIVAMHGLLFDVTEKAKVVLHAKRYEIGTGCAIVVGREPDGFADGQLVGSEHARL
jgi:hypothetical protein